MEKILVYKGLLQSETEIVPIDELCHGLISRARFSKFFEKGEDPVLVVPNSSVIALAVLWLKDEAFPVKSCESFFERAKEIFLAGDFSEKELKDLKKFKAKLQTWSDT